MSAFYQRITAFLQEVAHSARPKRARSASESESNESIDGVGVGEPAQKRACVRHPRLGRNQHASGVGTRLFSLLSDALPRFPADVIGLVHGYAAMPTLQKMLCTLQQQLGRNHLGMCGTHWKPDFRVEFSLRHELRFSKCVLASAQAKAPAQDLDTPAEHNISPWYPPWCQLDVEMLPAIEPGGMCLPAEQLLRFDCEFLICRDKTQYALSINNAASSADTLAGKRVDYVYKLITGSAFLAHCGRSFYPPCHGYYRPTWPSPVPTAKARVPELALFEALYRVDPDAFAMVRVVCSSHGSFVAQPLTPDRVDVCEENHTCIVRV
jgi:hypothetical protein